MGYRTASRVLSVPAARRGMKCASPSVRWAATALRVLYTRLSVSSDMFSVDGFCTGCEKCDPGSFANETGLESCFPCNSGQGLGCCTTHLTDVQGRSPRIPAL